MILLMALFTLVVEISIFWLGYLMYHGLWHCKHIFCCLIFTDMIRAWQFSSTQKIAGRAWLQSLLSCLVLESLMRRWNKPWWTYGPLVLISLLWGSIYRLAQYLQQFPIESRHLLSLWPVINNGKYLISQPTEKHLTVREYVTPEKFQFWKEYGESVGFRYVASGPLVSDAYSSYSLQFSGFPLYMANNKCKSKTLKIKIVL